jgi:transcriptional regulator with XRE-family HTH domain
MAESSNSKRVIFPPGEQKKFLEQAREKLGLDLKTLARLVGTGVRNLSTWQQEKGTMTLFAVERLCEEAELPFPQSVEVKESFWYTVEAAKKGGKARYEKYGVVALDEKKRKQKWREWWEREGQYKELPITKPLPFQKPEFSKELAEFIGILLGDGGISDYQITITLNSVDDKEYSQFVEQLVNNLFHIPVGTYQHTHDLARRIVISRIGLVEHLTSDLIGLYKGNKITNQVDIPPWIMANKDFQKACMRGLMDTDGGVVIHRYRSNGKMYQYKKLSFTSRSYPLLLGASQILANLGIQHRITKNRCDIRVESQKEVEKYFLQIGSSNPKHTTRYYSN